MSPGSYANDWQEDVGCEVWVLDTHSEPRRSFCHRSIHLLGTERDEARQGANCITSFDGVRPQHCKLITGPSKASHSIDPYLSILSYGRDMVPIWKPHAGPQSGECKGAEIFPLSSHTTATLGSHGPMLLVSANTVLSSASTYISYNHVQRTASNSNAH